MISLISKLVLEFIGWDSNFDQTGLTLNNSCIVILPHTSIFEFLIGLPYSMILEKKYRKRIYTIMRPQSFETYGWILDRLNCIRAPKNENRNSGVTDMLANKLNEIKDFTLVVAPKGTRYHAEWRTGFWHLAKKTNSTICAYAFDYYNKRLVYLGNYDPDDYEQDEFISNMKEIFSSVTQLHPEREGLKSQYTYLQLLPADPIILSNNLLIICCLLMTLQINIYSTIVGLISSYFTYVYHRSKERKYKCSESIVSTTTFFLQLMFNYMEGYLTFSFIDIAMLFLVFYLYSLGWGRHQHKDRLVHYIVFHSLFHLSIILMQFMFINF